MESARRLLLLRHAKSGDGDAAQDDHERSLNARGERAALQMGEHLAEIGAAPGVALCSTALRTRQTLERVSSQLATPPEPHFERGLYLASPGEILGRLQELEPGTREALVVGHNPGIGELALGLIGRGDPATITRMTRKYPTGALAVLRFPGGDWGALACGCAELSSFTCPKDLA